MLSLALIILFSLGLSHKGLDIPDLISDEGFKCYIENGFDFTVFRGYRSLGDVDPNACSNLKKASQYGFKTDVYFFPCVPKGNPAKQIDDMITGLQGCPYSRIFLDIEEWAWTTKDANREFITILIDTLIQKTGRCDIYTNKYEWNIIVGSDFTYGSKCSLWYPHWDNMQTFNDFISFSGWTSSVMKQYSALNDICGYKTDLDFYP